MPAETTFKIDGINKGQPFVFGQHVLTPRAVASSLAARNHALKEALAGTKDLPDRLVDTLMEDAEQTSQIAQANTLLFECLCRIDPDLRGKGVDFVVEMLDMKQYGELMEAIGGEAEPEKKQASAPLAEA